MGVIETCFENWIGLRGACDDVVPGSGKYINTLPGINLRMIANLSNQEQASYKDVWEKIYSYSLSEIANDFIVKGQKYFKTKMLLENQITGRSDSEFELRAAENKYKGIAIDMHGSKYTDIFIQQISLYTNAVFTDKIYIYDFFNGELLDEIDFTSVIGVNKIMINKNYSPEGSTKKIFIAWDANLAQTVDIVNSGAAYQGGNKYTTVRSAEIAKSTDVIESNMQFGALDHGMIVTYSLNCSVEAFMCSVKNLLTFPLWYKLGANLMSERVHSDRLNFYTLVNMEEAGQLMADYEEKYNNSITEVLNNLEVNQDGICYTCNKRRISKTQLP